MTILATFVTIILSLTFYL
uniref:E3 n=1 Tax=Lactococcus phage 5440 TaxID=206062 RepID=Q7Y4G6_9CAUD|nr:E3 [Lactococcus phage 5440]